MSGEKDVTIYEGAPPALRLGEVKAQVELIQEIMKSVMRDGEHYGKIPGCGDKPTLLQPGAQKLVMTFRLVPDPEIDIVDLPNEHREYRIKVKLYTQNGIFLGAGVGSCSTMEGKFRFRKADLVCPDCGKETIIKGKAEFGGGWLCYQKKGGCGKKWTDADNPFKVLTARVEHDNPADYYNTCEKMAFKRALVSATLTVTAASDIFTQDVEDMPEVLGNQKKDIKKPPIQPPQVKQAEGTIIKGIISKVEIKTGEKDGKAWTKYGIYIGSQVCGTFDKKLGEAAQVLEGSEAIVTYEQKGKFLTCTGIEPAEESKLPESCTETPSSCDHSKFSDLGRAFCGDNGPECKFQKFKGVEGGLL